MVITYSRVTVVFISSLIFLQKKIEICSTSTVCDASREKKRPRSFVLYRLHIAESDQLGKG